MFFLFRQFLKRSILPIDLGLINWTFSSSLFLAKENLQAIENKNKSKSKYNERTHSKAQITKAQD